MRISVVFPIAVGAIFIIRAIHSIITKRRHCFIKPNLRPTHISYYLTLIIDIALGTRLLYLGLTSGSFLIGTTFAAFLAYLLANGSLAVWKAGWKEYQEDEDSENAGGLMFFSALFFIASIVAIVHICSTTVSFGDLMDFIMDILDD